jgi:hypothetical protein
MDRLLNVMTVFSLVLIGLVLASVRRAHIRVEYSVSWLLAGFVLLVLSLWSGFGQWVATLLGLNDTRLALLMVAGGVFLVVLYRFSMIISRLKDFNIALAQKVAILEYRLESLHEENKTTARN